MNRAVKNILIFTAGAGVGATVATLYLRNFYTNFINETLTEEVNKELDKIKQEYQEALEKADVVPEALKSDEKPKASSKKSKEQKKEEAIDYTKFSAGKKKETTVKEVKKEAKSKTMKGIEYITFEDYTENNGFDKITTTYFAGDNVFMDDFDNPDTTIGAKIGKAIKGFDDYGEGDDLYLRDEANQIDYEVIYNEGTYSDYVTTL